MHRNLDENFGCAFIWQHSNAPDSLANGHAFRVTVSGTNLREILLGAASDSSCLPNTQ
ncbi:MAG TPA: hypothetical protein VLC09_13815 [Polyangiaceae bacterium]|nr:hypothetical protein [Polyangiaceae bacterium]